jgi:hypothetical protein
MMNLKVVEWKLEIKYVPASTVPHAIYIYIYTVQNVVVLLGVDCQSWILVLLHQKKKGWEQRAVTC